MSLGIDDSGVFSRLQLAKALKEDPDDPSADLPENSAIFLRQRARKSGVPAGQFYIPRPSSLLTPPVLSTNETQNNESQHPQEGRRNSPNSPNANVNVRGSILTPGHEEKRGSPGKPATLLDVRKSMLDTRQNIHNMIPFSPASSHRTSQILQQHKSLPDLSLAKQSHGASRLSNVSTNNSRQSSLSTNSSRPTSSNNLVSRPTSMFRSSKSFVPQDSEDSDSSSDHRQRTSPKSLKPKSKKLTLSRPNESKHKKVVDDDESSEKEQMGERSITKKSAKKHKHAPKGKLEKVQEEDSDESEETDESDDEEDDDDESDSEEDDTPLALRNTPKIRVAAPSGTVKKDGGIIEAWLDNVSSSPEPEINVRHRRPSSGYVQTPSSPLGPGHRPSLTPEPPLVPGNRRPRSSAENNNYPEQRKRANSEYVPKRNSHIPEPQFTQIGRISPSPRQDSGYWARDTLAALAGDVRHLSLMNDSPNGNLQSRNDNARHPRHTRSKDSLSASTNNRQSHYVTHNSNIHCRVSSEHLSTASKRISHYQQSPPHQQKHRMR